MTWNLSSVVGVEPLARQRGGRSQGGKSRRSSGVMRRRQVKRLGYQAHHIRSLHFRIYLPVTRFGCGDNRRIWLRATVVEMRLRAGSMRREGYGGCAGAVVLGYGRSAPLNTAVECSSSPQHRGSKATCRPPSPGGSEKNPKVGSHRDARSAKD